MKTYAHGLDILGGQEPVPVEVQHDGWHHYVTFVGMLASLATLWMAIRANRKGHR